MTFVVRPIEQADADQALQLGAESFGVSTEAPSTEPVVVNRPGRRWLGAFDGDRLVAQAIDREYDSWFGCATIPTSGVAYVGVSPEYRGQGLVRSLLTSLLDGARDRGAAIATLFPTAPGIYRGLGFERITDLIDVRLPTGALSGVSAASHTGLRRATADDMDEMRRLYDNWASSQNGPLTRAGASFRATDAEAIDNFTGVTLALDESGEITGFASWNRGQGYDSSAEIRVLDLIAVTGDAHRALLRMVASFAAVTPHVSLRTSGDDVLRMLLPASTWQVTSRTPYMLHVLDVAKAVSLRQASPRLAADLAFAVGADSYLLSAANGAMTCSASTSQADRVFTPQGFAALYGGAQSCGNLRFVGGLSGGDVAEDAAWDAIFGGRQVHIRDYF